MRLRKITFKEYNFDTYLKCRRWIQSLGGDISLVPSSEASTNILEYTVFWGTEPRGKYRTILPVFQSINLLRGWKIK